MANAPVEGQQGSCNGDHGFGQGFGTLETLLDPEDILYLIQDAKLLKGSSATARSTSYSERFANIAGAGFDDLSMDTHLRLGYKVGAVKFPHANCKFFKLLAVSTYMDIPR